MRELCHIFPDTNVFLHFPPLRDIDWCAIAESKEVELVVCMTVIHELDAKKSDSRLSSRAERAIKEIRDAQKPGTEIRNGVRLSIFNREIRAVDFPDTLSPESADDRIVHLAKLHLSTFVGNHVVIATGDYGMELRASAAGVDAISLGSSLRLPTPQDELTRKYRQAIAELNAIKNRLPKLTLGLAPPDGSMVAPHKLLFEIDTSWTPLDINSEMRNVKQKHPKQSGPHSQSQPILSSKNILPSLVSQEAWQKYDRKLDQFYDECREHFEFVNAVGFAKSMSFCFDLWLQNDGSGMATDIDVFVEFPSIIRFVAEKDSADAKPLVKQLKPPEAPEKPRPMAIEGLSPRYLDTLSEFIEVPELSIRRNDEWTPDATIHRSEDHISEIRVQVGKLKHGHNVRIGQFVAVFGKQEDIGLFEAACAVTTSELSEKVTVLLPFIARVKGVTPHS